MGHKNSPHQRNIYKFLTLGYSKLLEIAIYWMVKTPKKKKKKKLKKVIKKDLSGKKKNITKWDVFFWECSEMLK